ncbi:uncharacterized protein (UPF0276 family) [Hymenobacter luteus]|uniref:Uncharacterized protein (UPF0276 family) n=2 Tax=Hymenobacter TaxID=89966 RepID=A0A7W9WBA2_9BACT|nr:DUF692 family multinuclear iron-containing protein [Hymenobacter latericoloratus]MBB4599559.1 uncharacterized protein (UPF0276 family) [Hymenobacter latericoloratus]MBB6058131.1 uncharacterized protein (UPF0276 family) [Hymenobacter luteus]
MQATPTLCSALACNLDVDILSAALPLLAEGRVEALEWSFDALFWAGQIPDWFSELLRTYSASGRLLGHGVFFSLLSGRWSREQQQWLTQLRQLANQLPFAHITEHFGFFTGQNFHSGAPLPVPYTPVTLRLGQDRLSRLYEACQCPVGLENLAFAYALEEVKRHGEFLDKLLEPVNGFLILDLHNLYCQLHNFSISYEDLIDLYPLHRVREIHISGGSWEASALAPGQRVRRDTHDQGVPEEVFQLLQRTMPRCPHLRFVVLEQLGNSLRTEDSRARFRLDFGRMEALVQEHRAGLTASADQAFLPLRPPQPGPALEEPALHEQQQHLSRILETAPSVAEARQLLLASPLLASTDWNIEQWAPHMLETAVRIAQKWK